MMLIALVLLLLPCLAAAAVNTFPTKSVNLDAAPPPEFYNAVAFAGAAGDLEDPHPVHGIETSDGGFVFVGKALECGDSCGAGQSSSATEAFALKISADGTTTQWGWRSNSPGPDVANSVAELPNGGGILVAGFRTASDGTSTVAKRSVTKLDLATGAETGWGTATDFGDSAATGHGAWESIVIEESKGVVLLGGFGQNPSASEMAFKSYGNTGGGVAAVVMLPISAFAGVHECCMCAWCCVPPVCCE